MNFASLAKPEWCKPLPARLACAQVAAPPATLCEAQCPSYTCRTGVKKAVNENQNLWGMLTSDTFTPLLEFDYLGPDAWEALGRSAAEVSAMGAWDKLELRGKQVGLQHT